MNKYAKQARIVGIIAALLAVFVAISFRYNGDTESAICFLLLALYFKSN